MRSIQVTNKVLAHLNPITELLANHMPNKEDQIISIGHDGHLRTWNSRTLEMVNQIKLPSFFLMCIVPVDDGFFIGTGNGELLKVNGEFKIMSRRKYHNDCISSIIVDGDSLITTGYDGIVKFVNRKTLQVVDELTVNEPILQAVKFQQYLYLAGNPALRVSLQDKTVKEIKRYDFFKQFKGKLYACSDDKGLTCLTLNSNSYIPCHFLMTFWDNMLAFSDQCIGVVNHAEHIQWKCRRIEELKPGYSIKTGIMNENGIFIAGDEGVIYRVSCTNFQRTQL